MSVHKKYIFVSVAGNVSINMHLMMLGAYCINLFVVLTYLVWGEAVLRGCFSALFMYDISLVT